MNRSEIRIGPMRGVPGLFRAGLVAACLGSGVLGGCVVYEPYPGYYVTSNFERAWNAAPGAARPARPEAPAPAPLSRPAIVRQTVPPGRSARPRVCVLVWAGLRAVSPYWLGHAESPRRQIVRCAGARALGVR